MSVNYSGLRMAESFYPPELTEPMREEMVRMGAVELRSPEDVDAVLGNEQGSVLVVVNSVCGCAAGQCRPGVANALQTSTAKPNKVVTVFAGVDRDATTRAREYFEGYPPSSPQVALMKNGKVVTMLQRRDIENRSAQQVAEVLQEAFQKYCA